MKITVELSEALLRRAKAEAALRGCAIDELVNEGLRFLLRTPGELGRTLEELMSPARGVIDSGLSDLGPSSRHLKGFAHHPRRST